MEDFLSSFFLFKFLFHYTLDKDCTMKTDLKLKALYKCAYNYLKSKIGRDALERKLNHYRHHKANNMQDLFWYMLNSLTNKVGMRATIGDIDLLEPYLFNFDPYQTHDHYRDDWQILFKRIRDNYTPPGPMNIKNKNSYWVIFCKGILSGAEFLSGFESYDAFDDFVNGFTFNDLSISALPILLDQEIYGMGFPIACDWLKEIGYSNYCKPDTHTIDILFEAGVAPSQDNFTVFQTMVRMARINDEPPAVIDRLLWLIGSGKYVEENEKITRQKGIFIQGICPILDQI
jgi:hypothetical protein